MLLQLIVGRKSNLFKFFIYNIYCEHRNPVFNKLPFHADCAAGPGFRLTPLYHEIRDRYDELFGFKH